MDTRETLRADAIELLRRRRGVQLTAASFINALRGTGIGGPLPLDASKVETDAQLDLFIDHRTTSARAAIAAAKHAAQGGKHGEFLKSMGTICGVLKDGIGSAHFGSSMGELRLLAMGVTAGKVHFHVLGVDTPRLLFNLTEPANRPRKTSAEERAERMEQWRQQLRRDLKQLSRQTF